MTRIYVGSGMTNDSTLGAQAKFKRGDRLVYQNAKDNLRTDPLYEVITATDFNYVLKNIPGGWELLEPRAGVERTFTTYTRYPQPNDVWNGPNGDDNARLPFHVLGTVFDGKYVIVEQVGSNPEPNCAFRLYNRTVRMGVFLDLYTYEGTLDPEVDDEVDSLEPGDDERW